MATRSSDPSRPASSQDAPAINYSKLTDQLHDLHTRLEAIIKHRRTLGEYNADSADILVVGQTTLSLIEILQVLVRE